MDIALKAISYIEIGSSYVNKFNDLCFPIMRLTKTLPRLEVNKRYFEQMFKEYPDFDDPEKKLKNYFKSSKALKMHRWTVR